MGRPPSNGGPAFRFTQPEVAEMEAILQEHNNAMPSRDVLTTLAEKFSESQDRKGKIAVQMKQVWNWFQNKRYAIRAKSSKTPGKLNITPMPRDDYNSTPIRSMPQQPTAAPIPAASATDHMRSNIEENIAVAQQSHWKTAREEACSGNAGGGVYFRA